MSSEHISEVLAKLESWLTAAPNRSLEVKWDGRIWHARLEAKFEEKPDIGHWGRARESIVDAVHVAMYEIELTVPGRPLYLNLVDPSREDSPA